MSTFLLNKFDKLNKNKDLQSVAAINSFFSAAKSSNTSTSCTGSASSSPTPALLNMQTSCLSTNAASNQTLSVLNANALALASSINNALCNNSTNTICGLKSANSQMFQFNSSSINSFSFGNSCNNSTNQQCTASTSFNFSNSTNSQLNSNGSIEMNKGSSNYNSNLTNSASCNLVKNISIGGINYFSNETITNTETNVTNTPLNNSILNSSCLNSLSSCKNSSNLAFNSNNEASPSLCSTFIEPFELKRTLDELSSKFLVILLDCRSIFDFDAQHIMKSVHLNCRDKLTRKRLQSKKLTVKDLISCEEIKSKFDLEEAAGNNTNKNAIETCQKLDAANNDKLNNKENKNEFCESINNNDEIKVSSEEQDTPKKSMIVLYDDGTSDIKDLQSDSNPLKIVQENIKQCGFKNQCKILKGGFQQFLKNWPEFCYFKEKKEINKCQLMYDQQLDQQQSAIDNAVMTQITPYLYLGNELDAKNEKQLEKDGIYYILNVTKNIPFYDTLKNPKFVYKRIAVNDCINQNLKQHFDEAFEFIDEARRNNSKVLVHCQAGISRSPTIVIAYLMNKSNIKMNEAYDKVRELRPIIAPNLIFMSQLKDFENKLATQNNIFQSESNKIKIDETNRKENHNSMKRTYSLSSSSSSFINCLQNMAQNNDLVGPEENLIKTEDKAPVIVC